MTAAQDAEAVARFGAALAACLDELDWPLLERAYCEGDARGFFSPEQVEAQRDAGLAFAADLADRLGPGRSLYVGAGLAELPQVLFEHLVLEREVALFTLPGAEPRELDRALAAVAERLGCELPSFGVDPLEPRSRPDRDHLWIVSVLSDPVAYPALHAKVYGHRAPRAAALAADRERARRLLRAALSWVEPPALLHTTDEELALVRRACDERGWRLREPDRGRLSPIVGDVVRACRVELR